VVLHQSPLRQKWQGCHSEDLQVHREVHQDPLDRAGDLDPQLQEAT